MIADFGMAHRFGATQACFGTPLYSAPEALDSALDIPTGCEAKQDVWALGITLHEMLFGVAPFRGADVYEIAAAIAKTKLQPPNGHIDDPEGWEAVQGMLTVDPIKRWSIQDVINSKFVCNAPQQLAFERIPIIEVPEVDQGVGVVVEQAVACQPEDIRRYVERRRNGLERHRSAPV